MYHLAGNLELSCKSWGGSSLLKSQVRFVLFGWLGRKKWRQDKTFQKGKICVVIHIPGLSAEFFQCAGFKRSAPVSHNLLLVQAVVDIKPQLIIHREL